jgi:hypothetical protein
MRITIASILVSVAICLGMLAAAPGNLHISVPATREKRPENLQSKDAPSAVGDTRSPIRHLIVVVGENRSFDNVFGTYVPPGSQTIWNLLSKGIVFNNGQPGHNVALAAQQQATDTATYELSPTQTGVFNNLPQPNTTLSALPVGPCILAELFLRVMRFAAMWDLMQRPKGSFRPLAQVKVSIFLRTYFPYRIAVIHRICPMRLTR